MIVVEDIKKDDKVWVYGCGIKCEQLFIFKALERKKQIKIICQICKSTTVVRHMANGKISRKWFKGEVNGTE